MVLSITIDGFARADAVEAAVGNADRRCQVRRATIPV
jgi:hypothetical protein